MSGPIAAAYAIARTNLILMLRDRSNLVSMALVPVVFVFLIGTQFGGEDRPTVGVVGEGSLAAAIVDQLEQGDAVDVRRIDDVDDARRSVANGGMTLAVVVPDSAPDALPPEIALVTPESDATAVRTLVSAAVAEVTLVPGVVEQLAALPGAPPPDVVRAEVDRVAERLPSTPVRVVDTDGDEVAAGTGRFDDGAAQQLVLMVFLFTLYSAIPMAQSRRLGITRRVLSTPTSLSSIIAGEALGRWFVAVVQGAYIMIVTSLLFGVSWGSVPAAVVVLAVFGAVGAGAGTLLGAWFDDETVLVGLATIAGLVIAAVGGAMLPAELFSSTLRRLSRATPHSWALDAFAALRDGAGVGGVGTELVVLVGAAAVMLAAASWSLRWRLR